MKVAPRGFDGYFTASVFDLKRQTWRRPIRSSRTLQNQTGEVTSRGIELEAVANATRELKLIGSFTAYHLFNSKDLDPSLVGKTPTNTPELLVSGWADYTFKDGPLRGSASAAVSAISVLPGQIPPIPSRFPRSCSAISRSTTNGRTGAPR